VCACVCGTMGGGGVGGGGGGGCVEKSEREFVCESQREKTCVCGRERESGREKERMGAEIARVSLVGGCVWKSQAERKRDCVCESQKEKQ